MRHCFLVNVHKDTAQAERLLGVLRAWFSESDVLVYHDGPEDHDFLAHITVRRPYEPNKCKSLVGAVDRLLRAASEEDYDLASFLHADMVPTHKKQFYKFLSDFESSDTWLTYAPMLPGSQWLDYCNLHFQLPFAYDKLFPVHNIDPDSFNERELTLAFDANRPDWRDHAYKLWTLVFPWTGMGVWLTPEDGRRQVAKAGHLDGGVFVVDNYTPETSVLHTQDAWFWEHAEEVCRWG